MRENRQIEDLLTIFNQHKHLSAGDTVNQFLIKWQQFAEDQTKRVEQNYIWQLVHGQQNQIQLQNSSQIQTYHQADKVVVQWRSNWEEHKSHNSVYLKVSNNSAIIRVEQCVYFINPTSDVHKFSKELDIDRYMLYIVLTNSNLQFVMSVFPMIKESLIQRIITSQTIFRKMVTLDSLFADNKITTFQNILRNTKVGILKDGEYFQYGRLLWRITSCCWYQPVYDLDITNKKNMHLYLQAPKIYQSKAIYTAWKKNFISEANYQKYTIQTEQKQKLTKNCILFQVEDYSAEDIQAKKYLSFIKKEVIQQLDIEEQDDIWECCQQLHFTKGQIIVKRGTKCDFVYALEKGDFDVCIDNHLKSAQRRVLYGLQDLKKGQKRYTFDLVSKTDTTVQRIRVENIQFHLYQYLSSFK